MGPRSSALFLFLVLPLVLAGQETKTTTKTKPKPESLDLETEHWSVSRSIPAVPSKEFPELLERYYSLWAAKIGPAAPPAGKLALKLWFDREEYNSQPNRTGGFLLKENQLHILGDANHAYNIGAGGPRLYIAAAYPGLAARKDVPPWLVSGLAAYLSCAQAKESEIVIDSLKLPQQAQSLLSLQNLFKGNDWYAFEKGFKSDGRDYEIRKRVIDLQSWAVFYWLFNAPDQDGGKSPLAAQVPAMLAALNDGKKVEEAMAPLLKGVAGANYQGLEKAIKDYFGKVKVENKDREEGDWLIGETAHYTVHVQKGLLNKKTKETERQILDQLKFKMELLFEKYALAFRFQGMLSQKAVLKLHKNRASYVGGGGPPSSAAYYNPGNKELVGYEDSEETGKWFNTICHEGCHQFFDLAFPGFYESDSIPMWFSEGLADCFGSSEIRGKDLYVFTLSGTASWRVEAIKESLQQGLCPSIRDLLGMGQRPFMTNAQIHYPQSWSFVHFLWNYPSLDAGKGQYSEVVIKLIEGFKVGNPRETVYKDAFQIKGKPLNLDDLEKEWRQYVKSLKVRK